MDQFLKGILREVGKSFTSNHFDTMRLHFKSRQRKVMQQDLETILIKVWVQFSTKILVISTLLDTVRALFEITRVHPPSL